MILGIDEVGRGPWAGPLVVGAVVLPNNSAIKGLTDSKKLSAKKRSELDILIREQALGWGLGWVHAEELDELGLSAALRLATIRAVGAVTVPYHEIIIDGTINFLSETSKGQYVTTMAKADLLIPAVSAASIIAKVARDSYMEEQDILYPGYGFASHVGYGTAKHQEALLARGITTLHRKSFAPIRKLLKDGSMNERSVASAKQQVTAKAIGNKAEAVAAEWLLRNDFHILERNWKTKYCEVDIIAQKGTIRYFVEVKYRSSANQGGAIAAITGKKLLQMKFGADLYDVQHKNEFNARLAVVTIDATGAIDLLELE
ncbi:MAG: ribonuclease HII [Candidatus Saccharimonadaceae bacterium]